MYNSSHKINIEEKEQKKCKKESGGCGQEKRMLLINFLPWHSKETTLARILHPFMKIMVKVRKLEFQGFMSYISDHLGWCQIICDKSGAF